MAGRGDAGGVETYERALVRGIAQHDRDNEYHVFCLDENAPATFGVEQNNVHFHVLGSRHRVLGLAASLPLELLRRRVDLFHATYVPPPFSPREYVFTLHCSSTFVYPEFCPPRIRARLDYLTAKGLKKARMVICVSENVRDIVAERFGIPSERMTVVHNGVGNHFRPYAEEETRRVLKERYGVTGRFFVSVARLQARKNIARVLEAFDRFRRDSPSDVKLVLAGKKSWTSDEIDPAIERLGLRPHIIELGYVPHEDLPYLYGGAEMLVFPSLWEGFGLPVVEAMACGTPVVTSNVSSLPEVAGGAAVLVDPMSVDEIADGIHRLSEDGALRDSLRKRGLEWARSFTWEKTAERTLDVYHRAAEGM